MKNFVIYKTDLGYFKMEYENDAIICLKKLNHERVEEFGVETDLTKRAYQQLLEYFEGKRKAFDVPYELRGTEFQIKVWRALCHIPYGETRSYKEIAVAVGNEKASRAIGMANNKNPINIIVPCHRVIGTSGKLVGYVGGLEMKEYLLNMEKRTLVSEVGK